MENNNTPDKELDSFVSAFTEGLEPDQVDPNPAETPPATDTNPDQGSANDQTDTAANDQGNTATPDPEKDDTKNQQKEPPQEPESDPEKNKAKLEETFSKSDKAFAELRTTNKAFGDGLMRLARLAKIDVKTPAQALEALGKHMDTIEAQHGNITYSEVEKIRQQDKDLADNKAQLQQQAYAGFEQLKSAFKLDDKAILSFADELKTKGINPFETQVDLVAQYNAMHFDELIAKAKEEGRQEELARREKVQTHSTIPTTRNGGTKDTGESINSVDALKAFLESK